MKREKCRNCRYLKKSTIEMESVGEHTLEAGDSITLKCGDKTIIVEAVGDIHFTRGQRFKTVPSMEAYWVCYGMPEAKRLVHLDRGGDSKGCTIFTPRKRKRR